MPWYISACLGRIMLILHLVVSVFAVGAVTHHWLLVLRGNSSSAKLARYVLWMAAGYTLAWLIGILIYPSYNVLIRKPPVGTLEATTRWAVGLFEIKEHLGSIAVAMLPLLFFSARNYEQLKGMQRFSYVAATWVFTAFVYYSFVAGALVTLVKTF